jgi:hypothetical protein
MDNIPSGEKFEGEQDNQQPSSNNNQTSFDNEYGQIADIKDAEELAYLERNKGREAALSREETLRFERETGLSEEEAANLEKSKLLAKAFPFAFDEEGLDENDFPIYVVDSGRYNYMTMLSHAGIEKTRVWVQYHDSIIRMFEDFTRKYRREGKEGGYPLVSLFETLRRSDRSLIFSREGIKISQDRGDKRLSHFEQKAIPLNVLSETTIESLCEILESINKIGEIEEEVSQSIRKSKGVDQFKLIIERVKGQDKE